MIGVVQGCARDGRARDFDRFQFGDRRGDARLADLYDDIVNFRLRFVFLEFACDNPPREL